MDIKKFFIDNSNVCLDTGIFTSFFIKEDPELNEIMNTYVFDKDSTITIYGNDFLGHDRYYALL